jgi:hypothetical protein
MGHLRQLLIKNQSSFHELEQSLQIVCYLNLGVSKLIAHLHAYFEQHYQPN